MKEDTYKNNVEQQITNILGRIVTKKNFLTDHEFEAVEKELNELILRILHTLKESDNFHVIINALHKIVYEFIVAASYLCETPYKAAKEMENIFSYMIKMAIKRKFEDIIDK